MHFSINFLNHAQGSFFPGYHFKEQAASASSEVTPFRGDIKTIAGCDPDFKVRRGGF
jgi:hypothetical protein